MSKQDAELIEQVREWEGVAETLEEENALLLTLNEALALQELPHFQKLLDRTTEVIYSVSRKCRSKQEAIYAQTAGGQL